MEETTPTQAPTEGAALGDANGDNVIDIMDVIAVNKFLLGTSQIDQNICDVNGDKKCDANDSLLLMKYALGIITQFPRNTTVPGQTTVPATTPKVTTATTTTTTKATTTTTKATTTTTKATTTPTAATTTTPTTEDLCLQVAAIVNQERAANGVAPLTYDTELAKLAQIRAQELTVSFSHTRPDGTMCIELMTQNGISYRAAAENIAYGQRTPEQVMNSWMNSEGHRKNILNADLKNIGVGCYEKNGTKYWVQLFVTRK